MPWKDEQGARIVDYSNAQIVDALIPPEYQGSQGDFKDANDVDRFIEQLRVHHQRNKIDLGGKPIADVPERKMK